MVVKQIAMRGGLAVALAVVGLVAVRAASPEDIIAERRAGYKHMGENFKAMKEAVEAGADITPFAAKAQEIVDWAKRIPTEFPPGTETGGGTHAKPEVWSERPGFEKLSVDLVTQAELLAKVAATGDKAAFAAQFKATGGVCGECHRTYRYKI